MAKCKTGLYRVRQVLAAREDDCGVPGYIDPNGKAVEVQVSPTFNKNINMIENNVAKRTLTRTPNIAGLESSNLAFTAWAKGSGDPAVEPAFGIYLEGCGFQPIALDLLKVTNVSGVFTPGETVTGAPSGATGVVRVNPRKNNGELYVEPVTGVFASGDTITGAESAQTADVDTQATAGVEYRPVSEEFQNLTIRSEEDSVLCKEGNGMLGTFTLTGDNSTPASFEFTFDGRIGGYYRVTTDTPTVEPIAVGETLTWAGGVGEVIAAYDKTNDNDPYLIYAIHSGNPIADTEAVVASGGANFSATSKSYKAIDTCPISEGVSYDPGQPPIIQCAEFSANGFKPILQQFVLDMQNEVVVREDLNSCVGSQPATITARNPQLTFNPEVFDVNDWDVYESWKQGELVTGFDLWIGKVAGNRIFIQMDKVQIQQIADGDRDGTAIFDITAMITSEKDDGELSIYFL